MGEKGFPTPEELRTISERLDSEIGGLFYYLVFAGEIPHRSLVEALQSGEISSTLESPDIPKLTAKRLQEFLEVFKDSFIESGMWTGWCDAARAFKEGREKQYAEYYRLSGGELAEIKSELQRKGWLND